MPANTKEVRTSNFEVQVHPDNHEPETSEREVVAFICVRLHVERENMPNILIQNQLRSLFISSVPVSNFMIQFLTFRIKLPVRIVRVVREDYTQYGYSSRRPAVLSAHVAQKCVQAGAIGGLLLVPVVSYLRKLPLRTAWTRVMVPAPFIGTAITLSMLFAMDYYKPMRLEGVDDRAFRIINNTGQVKVDKYSTVAMATGASIGAVTIGGIPAILAGASTGVAAGVGGTATTAAAAAVGSVYPYCL